MMYKIVQFQFNGSQSGTFSNTQEYRFIPVTIREMLFESVGKNASYSRIYPAIDKLGQQTNSNTGSYLNVYFKKYDKKLEQFIAHFERPKNIIGIIVFIDGEIVAIDKFPSFTYSEQVWDLMIRDCYGALAIISELQNKTSNNLVTKEFESLNKGTKTTIELLEEAISKTKKSITKNVSDKLQELLELTFDATLDTEGNPSANSIAPKSYVLKNDYYIGQVIAESDFNHLVSVVKRESFDPNALRKVNELRNKAKKQEKFSL